MHHYKTLENTSIGQLYQTFLEAFSDYAVPFQLSLEEYQYMLKRRGFKGNISVGAFKGNELVGFVLNGLRIIDGNLTAYDVMTGIIPESRKEGLSKEMFKITQQLFLEQGVVGYILEVLQENETAFHIYQKQGFEITRNYAVFKLEGTDEIPSKHHALIEVVSELSEMQWNEVTTFWEVAPSWQNSMDSVKAVKDAFNYVLASVDGVLVGYGIVDKKTGDIPQFAVRKAFRQQGIGKQMISVLLKTTEANQLSVINMDDSSEGTKYFLSKLGFKLKTTQYEMMQTILA